MKKITIIVFVALFGLTIQANAQLGVKLGYNFAKMSGDTEPGYTEKSLNNMLFGAFFEKDLIPFLDLRLGVEYSPKGYKEESGDLYNEWTLKYIEIPVQAKVKVGPVYALGGVYGAFATKGTLETQIGSADIDFDVVQLKKFDYGMKFGAGVQFGAGPLHIFAQG